MRFGRYQLVRRIGAGGMAEVFLAVRRGPRGVAKRLVIKRIAPARAADPRFVALFEQEARVGCDLSHGNLVAVFEFGRVGDHWFIAMEHVDGCDLGGLLATLRARGDALPAPIAARIGAELCRGLAHVHARGYVHRDVTPRNVLLSWDGQVKLSDYGVALAGDGEPDGSVRGTPTFMAPEQAAGGAVDPRADVFSLGAVLQRADADGALAAITARATAPDPADRFPSVDALRAALEPLARESDERALAAFLAGLRASATELAPRSAARGDGATAETAPLGARWLPPPGALDPTTAATASGEAATPLDPLDALIAATGPRPRRRSALIVLSAASALALALVGGAAASRHFGGAMPVAAARRSPPALPRPTAAVCVFGDGYYCGSTLQGHGGAMPDALHDDTLYVCSLGVATPHEVCPRGCVFTPPGEHDVCDWVPGSRSRE